VKSREKPMSPANKNAIENELLDKIHPLTCILLRKNPASIIL
jgi:hypothetical protein